MAAPILWTPRKNAFFLQENLHVRKIPRFGGGFWFRGGEVPMRIYGRGDFSELKPHFPHFPRFCVRIFRVFRAFVLQSLLRPLFGTLVWGFQGGVFVRGANLNYWGGCAHRLQ